MLDSAPFLSELAGWVEWLHEPTANYVRQLDSWAKLSREEAAGFISELGESDKAASAEGHGKAPFVTGGVLWGPVLFLKQFRNDWETIYTAVATVGAWTPLRRWPAR